MEIMNITSRLNNYNQTSYTPSASVLSVIDSSFRNAGDYRIFSGNTSNAEEAGWYGFKHNNSKGGLCIIYTLYAGINLGMGSGTPNSWTWRNILNF